MFINPTGHLGWRQIDNLGVGVSKAVGSAIMDIIKSPVAMYELGKALINGSLSLVELGKAIGAAAAEPIAYLIKHSKLVWTGKPTDAQVEEYGKQLGNVLLMATGSSTAIKMITKVAPKLGNSLSKVKKSGCNCFTAGTKILTDEGEKPIEEIEIGDKVLAKDDETGEMAYKEVEWLFQRDVEETYNITVGGEVITTTDEHPFWIVGKGWVESKNLVVGDVLTTSDGKELAIEKIEVKKEHTTVYNFMVKDFHTYFVSNLGIWTHNACSIGTDFGKQGILANNPGIKVNWGNKTKHGFDRMLERGVTTDMVNDWVRTGKALSQDGGKKFLFVTKDGAAVVAKDGTLVTVMHKHDFDEKMQSLVNTLYRK
ncbi:polymorphic toxin-type HINT domain-containing protein [Paenibacillus sp. 1P07SE]|uniref:polymorphic toxin-type HINT domain-containing protein n=1 Tax=Paenibacillus sp. 1P07SE TaxID=3132209 RepID=UPI0039A6BE98